MQKPVGMLIKEFKENLANCVNQSGLHVSILEMILGDIYKEVCLASEEINKQETAQYNKKIEEETKKEETNNKE